MDCRREAKRANDFCSLVVLGGQSFGQHGSCPQLAQNQTIVLIVDQESVKEVTGPTARAPGRESQKRTQYNSYSIK